MTRCSQRNTRLTRKLGTAREIEREREERVREKRAINNCHFGQVASRRTLFEITNGRDNQQNHKEVRRVLAGESVAV